MRSIFGAGSFFRLILYAPSEQSAPTPANQQSFPPCTTGPVESWTLTEEVGAFAFKAKLCIERLGEKIQARVQATYIAVGVALLAKQCENVLRSILLVRGIGTLGTLDTINYRLIQLDTCLRRETVEGPGWPADLEA